MDGGEEEAAGNEEETKEGEAGAAKKENTFNIYGTVKTQEEYQKTDFVKEIVDVNIDFKYIITILFHIFYI